MQHDVEDKPCVLVVDDEGTNIAILAKLLGDEHRVLAAKDGREALRRAESEPRPDIILLDVMMPGMNGFEVMRRLQDNPETRDTPVIFITALSQEADEAKGLDLGAVDYIAKPFNTAVVKARVRNHLQLQQAKAQLARQNEILRENVALREEVERITRHDLKTPLGMIINGPDLLLQDDNLRPDQRELAAAIQESGRRMLTMINNSLDLHKMETGRCELHPAAVDMIPVIALIERDLSALLNGKQARFETTLQGRPLTPSDAFTVHAEELLCYSLLANLLKNAVEAGPKGAATAIDLRREGDRAVAAITNTGAAPPEVRDRFFQKYVTHGKADGAGLGAYSAKLMAEIQGGSLAMAVSDEADTTTLTLTLPADEKQ
jgi:CheY-like chemotaxis protein